MKVRVKTLEEIINLDSVTKIKVDDSAMVQEIHFDSIVIVNVVAEWLNIFGEVVDVIEINQQDGSCYICGEMILKKEWVEVIEEPENKDIKDMSISDICKKLISYANAIQDALKEEEDV